MYNVTNSVSYSRSLSGSKQGLFMHYLIANWKSHKTSAEVSAWFETLKDFELTGDSVTQVICPALVHLALAAERIDRYQLAMELGTQTVSPFPKGAYTGAVAASMASEWASYTIVGHSEERRYFQVSNQEVLKKVELALGEQLTPIVCVDRPYAKEQLRLFSETQLEKIIVAYEPLAAIGSGIAESPEEAQAMAQEIGALLPDKTAIIYGGSVDAENLGYYLLKPEISGVLVGSASLDAESWKRMLGVVKDL
jgi:triosephosphate isomerase (TIM)